MLSPPASGSAGPAHDARGLFFPVGRSPPMPHRPAHVFDPAADQMKTTAEAADVIPLGASFPSLAMGMGDERARCFRQGLPCPANPKAPRTTPEACFFSSPVFLPAAKALLLRALRPGWRVPPAGRGPLPAGIPGFLRGPSVRMTKFMRHRASLSCDLFAPVWGHGPKADMAFVGLWCHRKR